MRIIIEISLLIVLTGLFLLIMSIIPAVFQIKKTVKKLEDFISSLEKELIPLNAQLKETIGNTNKVTLKSLESIEKAKNVIEVVEDVGTTVKAVNLLVKSKVTPLLLQVTALTIGINEGIKVFLKGFKKRGGDK